MMAFTPLSCCATCVTTTIRIPCAHVRGGRSSARETAARVAAGTVARGVLRDVLGVEVLSHVISIGASEPYVGPEPTFADLDAIDASPVRAVLRNLEKR